jgi:hypothetical protein
MMIGRLFSRRSWCELYGTAKIRARSRLPSWPRWHAQSSREGPEELLRRYDAQRCVLRNHIREVLGLAGQQPVGFADHGRQEHRHPPRVGSNVDSHEPGPCPGREPARRWSVSLDGGNPRSTDWRRATASALREAAGFPPLHGETIPPVRSGHWSQGRDESCVGCSLPAMAASAASRSANGRLLSVMPGIGALAGLRKRRQQVLRRHTSGRKTRAHLPGHASILGFSFDVPNAYHRRAR